MFQRLSRLFILLFLFLLKLVFQYVLNIRYLENTFGKSDLVRLFFSKLFVSLVMQIDRFDNIYQWCPNIIQTICLLLLLWKKMYIILCRWEWLFSIKIRYSAQILLVNSQSAVSALKIFAISHKYLFAGYWRQFNFTCRY